MLPTPLHPSHDREIESLAEFDEVVSAGGSLAGFRVQAVDLTGRTRDLLAVDATDAVFLGCPMEPEAAGLSNSKTMSTPSSRHQGQSAG